MVKTITLKRIVNGKSHISRLKRDVHVHIEILEILINRCIRRGILLDIDSLINTLTGRE